MHITPVFYVGVKMGYKGLVGYVAITHDHL